MLLASIAGNNPLVFSLTFVLSVCSYFELISFVCLGGPISTGKLCARWAGDSHLKGVS